MTISVILPELHLAQWEIVASPARFRVAACGRRFGKTLAAAGVGVKAALENPRGMYWWVAPTYDVTRRGWSAMQHLVRDIPGVQEWRGDRIFEFPNGARVEFKTANTGSGLRGAGLDGLIVDEAAFVRPDAWQADLRPALTDKLGWALFISTPFGRNWFWHVWRRGQDPEQTDWQSWQFPTSANPHILPSEIDDARELLPERTFAQEYLADFIEDAGAVFRNVEGCATATGLDGPLKDHRYIFGVDWGKSRDFTVIAIMDMDTRQCVALDRFNEIGWGFQRGRLTALNAKWRPQVIYAETNSMGGPNVEQLQSEGLPVRGFETTASSKGPLIESLALAFERGEISVMADPVLIGELQAYEMERLPSGRFRYNAPQGQHDDTVIALALAWHGANSRHAIKRYSDNPFYG